MQSVYRCIVVVAAEMVVVVLFVAIPAAVCTVEQHHCVLVVADCPLQHYSPVMASAGSCSLVAVGDACCCMWISLEVAHSLVIPCCHSLLTESAMLEVVA